MTSSRWPSLPVRTIGASMSGKMPGIGGRLPVVSRIARIHSRIAAWLLVKLYKLHMRTPRCGPQTLPRQP